MLGTKFVEVEVYLDWLLSKRFDPNSWDIYNVDLQLRIQWSILRSLWVQGAVAYFLHRKRLSVEDTLLPRLLSYKEMIEWNWKKLKIYKLFSPYWKWLLVTDYSDQNREKVSFKNIADFKDTLFQWDVHRHLEYCCLVILHLSYCSRSICQFSTKEYQLFIFSRFQTILFLCMISLLPLYFSVSQKN